MLAYGSFTSSRSVVDGNTPRIADGDLDIEFLTSGISTFLADELLDHVFGADVFPEPPNLQVGLSTANPGDDDAGRSEPSGNGYAKVSFTSWDAASAGASSNSSAITFSDATGSWGTIRDTFIVDSDDNLLLYAFVADSNGDANPQAVDNGDTVQFDTGTYDITIT